jgi:hypothetical protein
MMTPDFQQIFAPLDRYDRRRFHKQDDDLAALGDSSNGSVDSSNASRHISRLADLICEARPGVTRSQALDWLLHTKSGQAMIVRTNKRKDTKPVDKMQTLETFVKNNDGGMLSICKHIVGGGEAKLTEANFTKLATEAAKRDYPNDRPDTAFSKYFQANEVVRRAHQVVVKGYVSTAQQAGGDTGGAYAELVAKADALRKQDSSLSEAQAFARVYQNSDNRELAKRERSENRPVA